MRRQIPFVLIAALYVLYAGAFVFRTSFVVEGTRYFCLFDDAMISMRYARNVADGFGAVWNPGGEAIEGYTNPLWVAAMAAFHRLPLPDCKVSLPVQIAGIGFLLANLIVLRQIARAVSGDSAPVWLGGVVLTAFYLPLNNWALQGMEVGPATLLVSLAVCRALGCLKHGRFAPSLYLPLAVAVLLRMDLLIPSAIICGFLTLVDKPNRSRHCLWGIVSLGAGLAVQTGFRVVYYGDLLPNTYYLKMTGYPALLRIARGILVLWDFVHHMNWVFFLLPFALLLLRRDKFVALLVLVGGGQLAYSVYVGGDAWEWWGGANRYIAIAMPLFFVLFCCAIDTIAVRLTEKLRRDGSPQGEPLLRPSCVMAFCVALFLLNVNALKGPASLKQWALLEPPLHARQNKRMVERALLLKQITRPNARIAVVWAGIMPYFADRRMIDISGKNDGYVARLPMHRGPNPHAYDWFLPGHLKWDYAHSIGRLRPDVALQTGYPPGEARPYLVDAYEKVELDGCKFHLRKQSPNLLWQRVAELTQRR